MLFSFIHTWFCCAYVYAPPEFAVTYCRCYYSVKYGLWNCTGIPTFSAACYSEHIFFLLCMPGIIFYSCSDLYSAQLSESTVKLRKSLSKQRKSLDILQKILCPLFYSSRSYSPPALLQFIVVLFSISEREFVKLE